MQTNPDVIRAERLALGLTQRSLAKLAKVSRNTLQSMERGESSRMPTIKKVADALNLDVLDLAVGETEVERQSLARRREMQEAS